MSDVPPSPQRDPGEFTLLLRRAALGDAEAAAKVIPLVYNELRGLAAAKMAHEKPGQTLQPTALVHEAWLRLGGDAQPEWQNRAHFFGAAAEAMRRILVERARHRHRIRHGGGLQRVDWEKVDLAFTAGDEVVLAVHEALGRLAQHDSVGARLIELRFFAGLSNVEAARMLGLAERTAKRNWAYARAWLQKELEKTA